MFSIRPTSIFDAPKFQMQKCWDGGEQCLSVRCPALMFDVLEEIGQGIQSTVYTACREGTEECDFVAKVQVNPNQGRAGFDEEVSAQNLAASLGIAPKIHHTLWCDDFFILVQSMSPGVRHTVGIMVMDKIKGIPGVPLDGGERMQLASAVQKMHRAGLAHGDLHLNNIIVEPSGTLFIIDFGFAVFSDNPQFDNRVTNDLEALKFL